VLLLARRMSVARGRRDVRRDRRQHRRADATRDGTRAVPPSPRTWAALARRTAPGAIRRRRTRVLDAGVAAEPDRAGWGLGAARHAFEMTVGVPRLVALADATATNSNRGGDRGFVTKRDLITPKPKTPGVNQGYMLD